MSPINTTNLAISPLTGFVPDEVLAVLPQSCYRPWEDLIADLPRLLRSKRLRKAVDDRLPVLLTQHLETPAQWRRASTILSFLIHGYVWESEPPLTLIPPSLAEPFLSTCQVTGMPPVQTYANLVLWNTTTREEANDKSLADLEYHDLKTMFSFTGTQDEAWFYLASAAVEIKGAKVVGSILAAHKHVTNAEDIAAAAELERCAEILEGVIPSVFRRVHERCDPDCFYNKIRPFLAGSNAVNVAGHPKGIALQRLDGSIEQYCLPGGSNAQGSLLQLCDLVLGIKYDEEQIAFFQDMRKYMPKEHRSLLEQVERLGSIAETVKTSSSVELREARTRCIVALKDLRKSHIGLVARYIVVPSRKGQRNAPVLGTAGSSPMPFLQKVRDQTALSVATKT